MKLKKPNQVTIPPCGTSITTVPALLLRVGLLVTIPPCGTSITTMDPNWPTPDEHGYNTALRYFYYD